MTEDELEEWPIYINDNGVVTCYGCSEGYSFEEIGRRTVVGALLLAIKEHAEKDLLKGE